MSTGKSNSVIGFALIGIILLCFTWYNTKQFEKQQREAFIQDSIAAARAMLEAPAPDSLGAPADSLSAAADSTVAPLFQNDYLNLAAEGEAQEFVLENNLLKAVISTKGAQFKDVLLKQYYSFDSTALHLIRPGKSLLDFEMNANQWLNTEDLNFKVVSSSNQALVLRLQFAEASYIDAVYALAQDSYMIDYNLHFVGMDQILDPRTNQMTMKWVVDMPSLEKGYQNEKNYSAVAYKYASNNDVKLIGQRKDSVKESFSSSMRWIGFQQQFFSAIIVAQNNFSAGTLVNRFYPEGNADRSLMQSGAEMTVDIDTRSKDFTLPFNFYLGPNHYPTLKSYDEGFEKIIPLGGKIIGTISRYVIIPIFNWLDNFISNYGIIILLLTLMIKLVVSPLTWKSYMSTAKIKVLQPEIQKINERYPKPEDAMKKQQATMELYRKADVSMFGGCLPILLQFPILWAMFRFFPASIELRQQGFLWCHDLSAYDSILDLGFKIPLYGDHISLFALLMGITMWGYSKMTLGQQPDNAQMPGMKFMQVWLMPIMMIFICNNLSAGLSYYYMLSNIITIGQNWAIRKWFVDENKIYANIQKKANSKTAPKKSAFQQRLEAAYKMQQEQAKQQKRK